MNDLVDFVYNLDLGLSVNTQRLMLSLLAGFPYAFIHRMLPSVFLRHISSIVVGLAMYWYVLRESSAHIFASTLLTWIILKFNPKRSLSVLIIFFGGLAHMLYLYWQAYNTDISHDPDVDVTVPYCIMYLKYAATAFDYSDATKPTEKLEPAQKKRIIKKLPNLFEWVSFCLFPVGAFIGPYTYYRHYHEFVERKNLFRKTDGKVPFRWNEIITTLIYCILHALVYEFVGKMIPHHYVKTEDFLLQPFWYKATYVCITYRIKLFKYVLIWMMTELAGKICGIAFMGYKLKGVKVVKGKVISNVKLNVDEHGIPLGDNDDQFEERWDGYQNIKPLRLMFILNFEWVVDAWHCKSNEFLRLYVFKRLRFLGNKTLSLAFSMLWLAAWHGIYGGYYLTFLLEWFLLTAEQGIKASIGKVFPNHQEFSAFIRYPCYLLFSLMTLYGWSYALIPFDVLTASRTMAIWGSMYYYVQILCVFFILLPRLLPNRRKPKKA